MSAERAGHRHCVGRRVERRGQVDVAAARSADARPGEATLVGLGLKSRQRSVHDVQVCLVSDVRIPIQRESAISRLERAVGVRPRRVGLESQAVGIAVAAANGSPRDRNLSALRALLGDGE